MKFIQFIKNYWKSILVTACILYLSFAPPTTFKKIPSFYQEDKLIHLIMYLTLNLALIFDLFSAKRNKNTSSSVFVLTCLIFPVLLGGLIEIFQPLYFSRDASWIDWLADIAGVIIGFGIMSKLRKLPVRLKN